MKLKNESAQLEEHIYSKGSSRSSGRLDLNNLLERVKLEKRKEKNNNLVIVGVTLSVVVVLFLLLSL